jgi:hypothetical protein
MANNTVINAGTNPDLANKLASDAMALGDQEAMIKVEAPKITLPPDTSVELPGGLYDPFNGLITSAEVRELTGVDEEFISKINDPGKALLSILERATVRIGEELATKELLDAMFAGDRELLLLAIRKVTFGTEVTVGPGKCRECGEEQTFVIDLNKDVEVKKLEGDREFTVNCKVGKVVVTLPKGGTQRAIVDSVNKTTAELDTILLKNAILSINGEDVINPEVVRNLGMKDRRTILEEITNRNPGPQLSQIKKECTSCGSEVPLPLTLADLFRE